MIYLAQSQILIFSCSSSTQFCPNIHSEITCNTTGAIIRWDVTGDVTGTNTFAGSAIIGTTIPVGDEFTAIKTDGTSFILNFTSQIEFNNSVTVICTDLGDGDSDSCIIMLYGKINK